MHTNAGSSGSQRESTQVFVGLDEAEKKNPRGKKKRETGRETVKEGRMSL